MASIIKSFLSIFGSPKGENAIASQIKLRAEEFAMRYGNKYPGLDFTPPSVAVLDGLLSDMAVKLDDMSRDQQHELASNAGSYLLWLAHKQFDGKFYWSREHEQPVFVAGEPDYRVALMPMQKIQQKIETSQPLAIADFYKQFAQQLAQSDKGTDKLFA